MLYFHQPLLHSVSHVFCYSLFFAHFFKYFHSLYSFSFHSFFIPNLFLYIIMFRLLSFRILFSFVVHAALMPFFRLPLLLITLSFCFSFSIYFTYILSNLFLLSNTIPLSNPHFEKNFLFNHWHFFYFSVLLENPFLLHFPISLSSLFSNSFFSFSLASSNISLQSLLYFLPLFIPFIQPPQRCLHMDYTPEYSNYKY